MNLAKRMAYLKKRDGLTTEMLSQRSGVAAGTLNKLLNGATRRPALETMERVARAFGVPVRYFTDAAVLGTEFEVARAGGCNTMVPLAVPEALATV